MIQRSPEPIAGVETQHLRLTPYTDADLDALFVFHSNPRVGRHTYSPKTREEAAHRYQVAESHRPRFGAAPWVARTTTSEVVGYGGLLIDSFDPGWGVEIAYFIAPKYWGRGYATEIAATGVAYAFERLRLDRRVSFAHPENAASNRVWQKAGFRFDRHLPNMDRN